MTIKALIQKQTLVLITISLVVAALLMAPVVHAAAPQPESTPPARWIVPANPRAVVIVLHGGAWWGNLSGQVDSMVPLAQVFSNRASAITMNIDYRSGINSLPDVIASYDSAKSKYPNLPICVAGASAGGNLALLLATKRNVRCVISEAGPTDINTTPPSVRGSAAYLLGEANFQAWSPLYVTGKINSPTILVSAINDPEVPHQTQAVPFKKRYPQATLISLKDGDKKAWFVHSYVDSAQLSRARTAEVNMIKAAAKKYQANR